jgi:hypothetical protein
VKSARKISGSDLVQIARSDRNFSKVSAAMMLSNLDITTRVCSEWEIWCHVSKDRPEIFAGYVKAIFRLRMCK